jgi:Leucine-rich repeat (LRR) protein
MGDEQELNETALALSGRHDLSTRSASIIRRGLSLVTTPPNRVLNFPDDRSVGTLFLYNANREFQGSIDAIGRVEIRRGIWAQFRVHYPEYDISYLARLKWNDIQELDLTGANVQDSDLNYIQGLTGLLSLQFNRSHLTDSGFMYIANMTFLTELDLFCSKASELTFLKRMRKLEKLYLKYCDVTDSGLANIQHLVSLRELDLRETLASAATVSILRKKLPNCKIKYY